MEKPKTTLSAQDRVIRLCAAIEIEDSHLKDGKLTAGDGGAELFRYYRHFLSRLAP
jgi:hypothetical protein